MSERTAEWLRKWFSTPREARKRKGIELTLSDECHIRLADIAESEAMSRSEVVEGLVMTCDLATEED